MKRIPSKEKSVIAINALCALFILANKTRLSVMLSLLVVVVVVICGPKTFDRKVSVLCTPLCYSISVCSFVHRHVLNAKMLLWLCLFLVSFFSFAVVVVVVLKKEIKTPPQNNFTVLHKY